MLLYISVMMWPKFPVCGMIGTLSGVPIDSACGPPSIAMRVQVCQAHSGTHYAHLFAKRSFKTLIAMSTRGNLTLILSALAAGAALGLLLAPAAGSETRRNLMRRGEGLRSKLNDLYDEGADFVSRKRDQFAEMADRVRDHAEEVTSGANSGGRSGSYGTTGTAGRSASSTGSTSSGSTGSTGSRSGNTGRS